MRVLYIGGTGQISFDCVHESVRRGHDVTVFNRGHHNAGLPPEVHLIAGDVGGDTAYGRLAAEHFDVVCQFRVFSPAAIERDIALFGGHCGQYVFVSSASAYEKPLRTLPITESVPLHNPYWDYSRAKAEVEARLRAQNKLLYTIVRPSHTYRTKMPMPLGGEVSRMLRGKPVVIHGDGESLWTITHAEDFARPFVRLLGATHVLGEAYHITNDRQWSWNEIVEASASALGVGEIDVVHVATDTLIAYRPEWEGPLLGDKSASVIFDNSKIKAAVGDFDCPIGPWEGMCMVAERYPPRAEEFDAALDRVYDRIVAAARRERHFAADAGRHDS
jgi:nucleoside-diphosphate-sugar epimerase